MSTITEAGERVGGVTAGPAGGELAYQSGLGNEFETEALPGTLPVGQNSPQKVAHGLVSELA